MKRIFKIVACLTIVASLIASLIACGNNKNSTSNENTNSNVGEISDSAINLLNTIWNSYASEEKFPASGGDEANLNFEGPGKFAIDSAEELDGILGFPASLVSKIDSAASLLHAMNANTFTCGVFHFKNANDAAASVDAIKENILARKWICGFPDTMLIMSAPGNYIIAAWGIEESTEIMSVFEAKVLNAVEGSAVLVNEPIV
jgi:hypothetical protein